MSIGADVLFRITGKRIISQHRLSILENRVRESEQRAIESQRHAYESEQRAIESQRHAYESEQRAIESQRRAYESERRASENADRDRENVEGLYHAELQLPSIAVPRKIQNILILENPREARERLGILSKFLRPYRAVGFPKCRIGSPNDGGYVCLDDFLSINAALSLGIGDDVSWDLDIAQRGIPVLQYDHTVTQPPTNHPLFSFTKARVCGKNSGGMTIDDIVAAHGIDQPQSCILKIDIENDEWITFADATEVALSKFSQIACEFHNFHKILDDDWYMLATHVFQKLHNVFRLVHVHGNNWSPHVAMGDILVPDVIELTFVNHTRYNVQPTFETFPGELDAPNHPDFDDFVLGTFNYCI